MLNGLQLSFIRVDEKLHGILPLKPPGQFNYRAYKVEFLAFDCTMKEMRRFDYVLHGALYTVRFLNKTVKENL